MIVIAQSRVADVSNLVASMGSTISANPSLGQPSDSLDCIFSIYLPSFGPFPLNGFVCFLFIILGTKRFLRLCGPLIIRDKIPISVVVYILDALCLTTAESVAIGVNTRFTRAIKPL